MRGRSGNGDAEKTVVYVTNAGELRELVSRLRMAPVVGIDTEFMRERTYFARLCLVQLGSDDLSAIVDPLAIDDLSPLCDLLSDPSVTKVLHAGSQDLEIFYRICDWPPRPSSTRRSQRPLRGFHSRSATVRWSKRCSVSSSTRATRTLIGPSVR